MPTSPGSLCACQSEPHNLRSLSQYHLLWHWGPLHSFEFPCLPKLKFFGVQCTQRQPDFVCPIFVEAIARFTTCHPLFLVSWMRCISKALSAMIIMLCAFRMLTILYRKLHIHYVWPAHLASYSMLVLDCVQCGSQCHSGRSESLIQSLRHILWQCKAIP